jgi:PPOX class probable FMN-dependent enzyme
MVPGVSVSVTAHGRPVTTEAELRELVADPAPVIASKAISCVDEESRRFIALSPMFLLATTDADGRLDVSPRGDPPGSVLVLDGGRALAFADRKGNRRLDSLRNNLGCPGVGKLFLVPGAAETLRVNGRATIVRDGPLLPRLAVRGEAPQLAVVVEVDELFVHCARSFVQASLWDPGSWPAPGTVPSGRSMFRSQAATRDRS